jgi:hypothetical protein
MIFRPKGEYYKTKRFIKRYRMRWPGHVARMGKRNTYNLLMGKPKGKRQLGRPRREWVDINMDLGIDWIGLARDKDK